MNSTWSERQKVKADAKEKDKVRKEKLASFFFTLAQLTYTALVLGGIVLFFQGNVLSLKLIIMLLFGGILAFAWAKTGNNLLK